MGQNQKHWNSKGLVLFGMWLWEQKEYGHALLCMHAPWWGLKIGGQLKITWDDVIFQEDCMSKIELMVADKDIPLRPINIYIKETIETAFSMLPIANMEDSVYMNYKTGKPLTSSTLNRELQRLSDKFLAEMKTRTGVELNYKPLKSNAFEIAWALDMVKKYHYSKQVFSAVSSYMGHRTIKDTIQLLEVEPNEDIVFDFENVKKIPSMMDMEIFKDNKVLEKFLFIDLLHDSEEWIPLV